VLEVEDVLELDSVEVVEVVVDDAVVDDRSVPVVDGGVAESSFEHEAVASASATVSIAGAARRCRGAAT